MIQLSAKKEIEGLSHDLKKGITSQADPSFLLGLAIKKLDNVLVMAKRDYVTAKWE